MAYNQQLANRVRAYLAEFEHLQVEEKEMFKGLAFMVNGKMCVNVSDQNLMCRFNPERTLELAELNGYLPMLMKGKPTKGYCYVESTALTTQKELVFWINVCLEFNSQAKSSKKRKPQSKP